jgi:sodium-dependent phosphate cotransporter
VAHIEPGRVDIRSGEADVEPREVDACAELDPVGAAHTPARPLPAKASPSPSEESASSASPPPATPCSPPVSRSERREVVLSVGAIFVLLYLFLLSISLLGSAFRLFGGGLAQTLVAATSNPLAGLFIGILATALVQSSSLTTSLAVGLVGGGALTVATAIPIIMGANVGTSVTNMIVSLGHISRKGEFRRAFAAATVHDFFNLCAVLVLFPLQVTTNFLGVASVWASGLFDRVAGPRFVSPIKLVVSPTARLIVRLTGESGIITLIVALVLLFLSLKYLVKILRSTFVGRLEVFFDKLVFRSAVPAMTFGLVLTALVQSSSITTSLVVPLAGAGILTLEQIFPYTLGANVGTTVTALLASLATGSAAAVSVALAHLFFNVIGILIVFPLPPLRRIPIRLATGLAELSIKNRLIPLGYILIAFYVVPILMVWLTR